MSAAVDSAIAAKLATVTNIATLAPGGIHNIVRPQGSTFPVVVFSMLPGGGDRQSYGGAGVEGLQYDVKVIAPITQQANVGALIEAIHTVLERGALTITGYNHLATLRVRRIPNYAESSGGVQYLHRGGTYAVTVAKA